MDTLNKNLQSFFVCIFILQFFGLIRLKESETLCEKILSRLKLILFIISLLAFFARIVTTPNDDLMIIYCQYIDRAASIVSALLIMVEFLICRHSHGSIFDVLSEIDDILMNRLRIKINYRTNLLLNCLMCASNSVLVYGIILSTKNFITSNFNFTGYFFFTFTISWFLTCVIQTFFVSIVLQIYLRFRHVEKFLSEHEENFYFYDVINELLMKSYALIEVINETFGITILIIAGERRLI